ncbi:hypothetical protein MRX96_014758 [Rhipicephalus microplus]
MLQRLWHLVEVQFSLVSKTGGRHCRRLRRWRRDNVDSSGQVSDTSGWTWENFALRYCPQTPLASFTRQSIQRQAFATSSRSSGTSSSLDLSSFHFGPDIDVTQLLQDGSQKKLRSFSASPCGLHRSSALRRLAQSCPDFQALVVRIDSRDRNLQCAGCSGDCSL